MQLAKISRRTKDNDVCRALPGTRPTPFELPALAVPVRLSPQSALLSRAEPTEAAALLLGATLLGAALLLRRFGCRCSFCLSFFQPCSLPPANSG